MEKTAGKFENDVLQIKNLLHSVKTMIEVNQDLLFKTEDFLLETEIENKIHLNKNLLNPMHDNNFAIGEILSLLQEKIYSNDFYFKNSNALFEYDNSISVQ